MSLLLTKAPVTNGSSLQLLIKHQPYCGGSFVASFVVVWLYWCARNTTRTGLILAERWVTRALRKDALSYPNTRTQPSANTLYHTIVRWNFKQHSTNFTMQFATCAVRTCVALYLYVSFRSITEGLGRVCFALKRSTRLGLSTLLLASSEQS